MLPTARKRPAAVASPPKPAMKTVAHKQKKANKEIATDHICDEKDAVLTVLDMLCSNMKPKHIVQIKANVKRLGCLRLGSACTGSNVTRPLAQLFFGRKLGVLVHELFTCEKDPKKAKFIAWVNNELGEGSTHVFEDITNLHKPAAKCSVHCLDECAVPSGAADNIGPFITHIGFSCKNFSKLYNGFCGIWERVQAFPTQRLVGLSGGKWVCVCVWGSALAFFALFGSSKQPGTRAEYLQDLLQNGKGSSGETFCGVHSYAKAHSPPFIVLENVPDVAESSGGQNVAFIVQAFSDIGYVVAWRIFLSTNFGSPQRRRRWFALCMRIVDSGRERADAQIMVEEIMQIVHQFTVDEPLPIKDFLLPNSHEYLKAVTNSMVASSGRNRGEEGTTWRSDMIAACRKAGFHFSDMKLPAAYKTSKSIMALPPREQQGLAYWLRADPELTSLDVQPSLTRMARGHDGIIATITPHAKNIIPSAKRLILGLESMSLQGFPRKLLLKHASENGGFSTAQDAMYQDLAGNAYTGFIMVIIMAVILCRATDAQIAIHSKACGKANPENPEDDVLATLLGKGVKAETAEDAEEDDDDDSLRGW